MDCARVADRITRMRSILCVLCVFACGGKQPDAPIASTTTKSPPPDTYGGATYGGASYDHTAELKTFHDRILPLAGPASETRRTAACAASEPLATAAKAITKARRPDGADPIWDGEARELEGIAEDLGTNCKAGDPAAIDYDIDSLHRSLQRLMKTLPTYEGSKRASSH